MRKPRAWWRWIGGAAIVGGAAIALARSGREVGAWTGAAAINDPAGAIALARSAGVSRLCVFVNDRSYANGAWRTYDRAAILDCAAAIRSAGLKLTLVSWMTPRPDWIVDGARELGQLATEARADEVELDLEEPWTVLRQLSDATIAERTGTLFRNLRSTFSGRVLVDFIVLIEARVMGPAIAASDGAIPQAYDAGDNFTDGELESLAVKRWAPFGKPIIMGVGAFSKHGGVIDTRPLGEFTAALAASRRLGIRRVRIWRLEMLSPELAQAARAFSAKAATA